jgi:galactose oxidase-like protein
MILVACTDTNAPPAPAAASPSPIGNNMVFARARHTATALLDGSVLVVGGSPSASGAAAPYSSAELYDPATGTFSLTGPMAQGRAGHTATRLPDGKVLVVGGWDVTPGGASTAELYDPATQAFSPTGSLTAARVSHTATLLPNGKVLIVGGELSQTAELYDPATGVFSPTGSLIIRPYGTGSYSGHTATLLLNGKVLVVGGCTDDACDQPAVLYDPGTGTFTPTGSMVMKRTLQTATLLANGKVLIAGGHTAYPAFAYAEIYDPSTASFALTGSMEVQRWEGHSATLLPSGQVLIAGGMSGADYPNVLLETELFDPISGRFAPAGQMANAHAEHQATLLSDGAVLVSGGFGNLLGNDGFPLAVATVDVYRGSWVSAARLPLSVIPRGAKAVNR